MSTFVCEKCGCVDNSACGGTYHTKDCDWWPEEYRGKMLCCVCASPKFNDGSINSGAGRWHNRFPRLTEEEWKRRKSK